MAIDRTKEGVWVVVGDTLRTPWVSERGTLAIDHLVKPICDLLYPGDTVIDVGANIGDHTYYYRQAVTESGRVVAFEPDPDCFACCVLNCGTFEDLYHAAATDVPRAVGLKTEPNRGQNIIQLEEGGFRGFPIDELELARCNLIKIDVEGAEMLVLKGAEKTIARQKPAIVCEIVEEQLARFGSSGDEVRRFLANLGYQETPLVEGWERDKLFVHPLRTDRAALKYKTSLSSQ